MVARILEENRSSMLLPLKFQTGSVLLNVGQIRAGTGMQVRDVGGRYRSAGTRFAVALIASL